MKIKKDNSPNNKFKLFCDNIVIIEEEWFSDMNLTVIETFPLALIKRVKLKFNEK